MKKKLIWVLLILVVLLVVFYAVKPKDRSYGNTDDMKINTEMNPVITASSSQTYTLSDISTHTTKSSCWSTIEGKVYDFTSFFGKHPGGDDAILAICGKDGSQLFDGKHGMDEKVKSLLPRFYLGNLAN